jgi:hypothetical protein
VGFLVRSTEPRLAAAFSRDRRSQQQLWVPENRRLICFLAPLEPAWAAAPTANRSACSRR